MNSVFNCPICWMKYNKSIRIPLTLSCGHVVCKVCVKNVLTKNNIITCSIDKISMNLDINNIPVCHTILEHVPQQLSSEFYCKIHQNKKVKYFCTYDNENFCSSCLVNHTKSPHKVNQSFPRSIH